MSFRHWRFETSVSKPDCPDNSEDFISVGRYMPKLSVSIWLKWNWRSELSTLLSGKRPFSPPPLTSKPPVFQEKGRPRHSIPKLVHLPV